MRILSLMIEAIEENRKLLREINSLVSIETANNVPIEEEIKRLSYLS
ncbi:hypothetical protein JXL21_13170 [Candidatus Bathyarchaeota archaeon]|nr:hypothetical protein [Candidatus Bathyarchaeota archaeon]